jgi:hypothetical protein
LWLLPELIVAFRFLTLTLGFAEKVEVPGIDELLMFTVLHPLAAAGPARLEVGAGDCREVAAGGLCDIEGSSLLFFSPPTAALTGSSKSISTSSA